MRSSVEPSALVVVLGAETEEDAGLSRVLATSVRIELERLGLTAELSEAGAAPRAVEPFGPDAAARVEPYLQAAAARQCEFLVVVRYTRRGEGLEAEFSFVDAKEGRLLATATGQKKIDLSLDELVVQAFLELRPQVEDRVAAVSRQMMAEAAQRQQGQGEGAAAAPGVQRPEELPVSPPAPAEEGPPVRPILHREAAVGGGVFSPLSPSLKGVFGVGYAASLSMAYRWNTAFGIVGLGLYSGFLYLLPEHEEAGYYFDKLLPIGLDARLSTPEGFPLGLYARAALGAALNMAALTLQPEDTLRGRLTLLLPQARGGAGISWTITPRFGLALEVLFELLLYLYRDSGAGTALGAELHMGFDPQLYLYTRW
jgi:hypothetical protein